MTVPPTSSTRPSAASAADAAAPLDDPLHVHVHRYHGLAVCEPRDGGGRVAPDSGQLRQIFGPTFGRDLTRRPVEVQRAPVVAEALPLADDVCSGRVRKSLDRRPALEPGEVARHDARDLRLLEHDLADEDRVRVSRPAPWEVAAVLGIPAEERA